MLNDITLITLGTLNHNTKLFLFFYNSLIERFIVYANIKNKGTCEI